MAGPLIEWQCIAAAHAPDRGSERPSVVTAYEGAWAYCDSPGESGHDWLQTGGIALDVLRRRAAAVTAATG
jgi:hypothetical protein